MVTLPVLQWKYLKLGLKLGAPVILRKKQAKLVDKNDNKKNIVINGAIKLIVPNTKINYI